MGPFRWQTVEIPQDNEIFYIYIHPLIIKLGNKKIHQLAEDFLMLCRGFADAAIQNGLSHWIDYQRLSNVQILLLACLCLAQTLQV